LPAAQDWLSIAQQSQVEVVAFLQDQVRFPSVNGRNDEATVAQRVAA
jgi:acetylornithine deacetylase/succinyl-diaminopimelate desuccinylase-like protein